MNKTEYLKAALSAAFDNAWDMRLKNGTDYAINQIRDDLFCDEDDDSYPECGYFEVYDDEGKRVRYKRGELKTPFINLMVEWNGRIIDSILEEAKNVEG